MGTEVGVVIRTLNEGELIGTCLDALRRQRGGFELDILVVDSGSTDATVDIARSHGARILEIAPAEFDYSTTLNLGVEHVRGDVVVVLSAHAIPVDDEWLGRMMRPFADPRVAGVASRQVPWPDAPWQEVHRLQHQFGDTSRVFTGSADGVVFSNAASAIRRSVWHDKAFTLPAAEDVEWAQRVVAAGWTIAYAGDATVRHSHREGPRAQALRMIDLHRVLDGGRDPRTPWKTLREAVGIVVRDGRKILALEETAGRKLAHLLELLRMAAYYVVDFSRSGTTAERRRRAGSAS